MESDLYTEILRRLDDNEQLNQEVVQNGIQYAENKGEYRKLVRQGILEERANGTPVTITRDLVVGREDVVQAQVRRDTAEAIYKANQEAIIINQVRIKVLDAQLNREWNQSGRNF